jgi:hypothetical protein
MASRETGCIIVTEACRVNQPTPHVQFHIDSDPPSGAVLQWTAATSVLSQGHLQENHVHPRHPEVTLSFSELSGDIPQHDEVRANRDTVIDCFQQVV